MKPILYRLSCHVTIGKLIFREVASLKIKSTWKQLTDTCDITIPKNLKLKGKAVSEYINRGDKVKVQLGYNDNLHTEFVGFVREIESDIPLKIHCEDYAYTVKYKKPKNKVFVNPGLTEVINYITQGIEGIKTEINAGDVKLGKLLIEDVTIVKILEALRSNYGLISYFKGDTLKVGFPYENSAAKATTDSYVYDFQNNIVPGHSLKYRRAENVKVKIKAVSNLNSGKKIIVEIGEDGGNVVSRNFPEMTKAELEKFAKEELEKYKIDGFSGSLTGWGLPMVAHGDSVVLIDSEFPDRKGKYLVDATEVSFTSTVFRRKVSIGQKAG